MHKKTWTLGTSTIRSPVCYSTDYLDDMLAGGFTTLSTLIILIMIWDLTWRADLMIYYMVLSSVTFFLASFCKPCYLFTFFCRCYYFIVCDITQIALTTAFLVQKAEKEMSSLGNFLENCEPHYVITPFW